jgi:signal transduction histidine kinase
MTASAVARRNDVERAGAPGPALLWGIGFAGFLATAVSIALTLRSDHVSEPAVRAALNAWVILPYVLAGLIAWWRRPDSRFGGLMVAAGFAMFLSSLSTGNSPVLYTIGILFDLLPAVLFLHVFLAFPTGRLERLPERTLVVTGYAAAVGLHLVAMMLGGFGPDNLLEITSQPEASAQVQRVELSILSACALLGIVVLAARRRSGGRPRRRSLALLVDSFALGLVMIAVLLLSGAYGLIEGQSAFEALRRATFIVIGLAPIAFLIALVDARLARSAVGDLVVELRAEPAPAALRDALARALRDPSLTLAYWLPQFESWADLDGRAVELPQSGEARATTVIDREGAPVAALVHDPELLDEPQLLDAVAAVAAIALENARLHAELRARLEEIRGSRARVIEAGQKERQRLERNLHDGAQQRLVALSLELGLLQDQAAGDPELKARLDRARSEIATSLEELRAVARGIHPAVVSGHGLEVALEQLAARAAVPVRLSVSVDGRLPETVEVAVYYVVSESLANIGKHAGATAASIDLAQAADRVVLEVVDDGVGGADSERGTGLRGLADRVEALEGSLRVWSPGGGGTRLRAEIPCGS